MVFSFREMCMIFPIIIYNLKRIAKGFLFLFQHFRIKMHLYTVLL